MLPSSRWVSTRTRVRSGKCVDLPGGDARNGNYLWLWECTGGDSQGWILDGQQIKYKANPGARPRCKPAVPS